MSVEVDFARIAHDIRGSLGSLRMVCNLLRDEPGLGEHRGLLASAENEIHRLAAGLVALPALAAAAAEADEPTDVDLAPEVRDAVAVAAQHGEPVRADGIPDIRVRARPAALRRGLPALLVLAAAQPEGSDVTVVVDDDRATLRFRGPLWPQGRYLAGLLATSIGWTLDDDSEALCVGMARP